MRKILRTHRSLLRNLCVAVQVSVLAASVYGCTSAPPPPTIDLRTAAYEGNAEEIRRHAAHGSNLNEKSPDGGTPLIAAATFNHLEAVKALVEGGADLNLTNNDGSTALLTAAFFCRTEVVQFLLDAGADKSIRNNAGSTALETVELPFEDVKPIYDLVEAILGPLGLTLDYEHIKATRPDIAAMLRQT
jgi:hypothetical protein